MNLIQKYLLYTKKHEAPEAFHAWTIITCIGASAGRKVFMNRGFYRLYAGQTMVILVGGSAIVRKSTAARIGMNLLKEAESVEILTGKASPEAFLDSLSLGTTVDPRTHKVQPRDSHVIVFAPELSSFLSKQAYTEALLPILTDLSDAPEAWSFKTRGKGEIALRNVCIAFLGATTPDWLAEAIPQNAFGGGFMSRIIFVYQESTTRRNPMPEKRDFERALEEEIIAALKEIATYSGEAVMTPAASKMFIEWYNKYMETPVAQQDGYYGRRADHLLRTAMTVAIGRGSPYAVDEIDVQVAENLLQAVETGMPDAFAQIGTTTVAREQGRLLQLFARHGGELTLRELSRATWRRIDINELTLALQTLKAAGFIAETARNGIVIYQLLKEPTS